MRVEVVVPVVGESISEGVLVAWQAVEGARVVRDQPLFELETDKITMQVDAPASGRLTLRAAVGARVRVGEVVGSIEEEAAEEEHAGAPGGAAASGDRPAVLAAPQAPVAEPHPAPAGGHRADAATAAAPRVASAPGMVLPPSRRRLARAQRLVGAPLAPAAGQDRGEPAEALQARAEARVVPAAVAAPAARAARETRRTLSSLRRRVAERLVQAQHQAAILTTFNEVDMSAVLALRARHQEAFVRRHGVKLGLMSFFVKAVVEALRQVPAFNARLEGDELVEQHYYDLGVAVGSERGLVVPVIRDADQLSLAAIERSIAELAERAAKGRLELAELQGGCFTISNGGVYGSLLSTPILNPPQCGILGLHAIKKRAVVVGEDDRIEARPMMYLALSYDHRVVDGREAVTFLRHVAETVAAPERLLLEL